MSRLLDSKVILTIVISDISAFAGATRKVPFTVAALVGGDIGTVVGIANVVAEARCVVAGEVFFKFIKRKTTGESDGLSVSRFWKLQLKPHFAINKTFFLEWNSS